MLVAQLAVSSAALAAPHLPRLGAKAGPQPGATGGGAPAAQAAARRGEHAVLLPDPLAAAAAGGNASGELGASSSVGGAAAHQGRGVVGGAAKHCPLCLSPRSNPACTPCGHVFCWHCIAQWCNEKPECPLCRAAVISPQLVCLYHSDM